MNEAGDFLSFRKMLTPIIIQIIFWVGVIFCVIGGVISIVMGAVANEAINVLYGIVLFIIGPLAVRIYCEILIVVFRINDTLTEIENKLDNLKQDTRIDV
ncbi:DUF4282 domain-containing protein [Candidatus Poribacteria bacterium]|nr:DUF4282 domain-containing protein [Candidatus Poribacteria bacterium]